MKVVTRFAPSPTGTLHIGGARTALFNFLYAKHTGGEFKLRIEDTDKKRSTKEFEKSILEGLEWLGLDYDSEIAYQSQRAERHVQVAMSLLEKGYAYYCYTPLEEIQKKRQEFESRGKVFQFQSEWRNKKTTAQNTPGVLRFKAPQDGSTSIEDLVQGKVTVQNSELDDMVLLRSDGTPTYMLAVVVDDYDMGVTHVIRGDDHLNNAFRQIHLYHGLDWQVPQYAHIPLIHSTDGSKLSKRHGALGLLHYRDEGYMPDALFNYLLRLGWGHGNDEIISKPQAIEWFDTKNINKSPAKLDFTKLLHLNAQYIKTAENNLLVKLITHFFKRNLNANDIKILEKGMNGLKTRAKTLKELAENAVFYIAQEPLKLSVEAQSIINDFNKGLYISLFNHLKAIKVWDQESLKTEIKNFASGNNLKLKEIAQVLRAALTGSTTSPSVFEIMPSLEKDKSLERLERFV